MENEYFDGLLREHKTHHDLYCLLIDTGRHGEAYKHYLEMRGIESHWHDLDGFAARAKNVNLQ